MDNAIEKQKKNLGESIRQRLKNLSEQRNRPFDEILRYYAMERFLYRLSISPHAKKFFLKVGRRYAKIFLPFLGIARYNTSNMRSKYEKNAIHHLHTWFFSYKFTC